MVVRSRVDGPVPGTVTRKITGSPFDPLVKALFPRIAALVPLAVTPNMITKLGLAATFGTALSVVLARFVPSLLLVGSALVLVNWVADTLDGEVARQRGQCSRLGDFYDHIFDAFMCAAINIGLAFSGLCQPVLPLLLGVVFLLNFAITYKGEQATGVYELLTFGPTEVRLGIIFFFTTTYFFHGVVLDIWGLGLTVLDLGFVFGIVWSLAYIAVLFRRYEKRLR